MIWKIAICEDNLIQQKNLSRMVKDWEQQFHHSLQLYTYSDCETFWFHWTEQMDFHILLLDIDFGQEKMTGMALAKQIRQKNPAITIIFITALSEYISLGYDVQAFHFLVKPIEENKLFEILERAVKIAKPKEAYLIAENEFGVHCIPHSKILYVEAFSHNIAIWQEQEKEITCQYFRMCMKDLEENLPSSFFRCHRSYLVHLNHIQKINKNEVVLDCGTILPVSRSKKQSLYQSFLDYHRHLFLPN